MTVFNTTPRTNFQHRFSRPAAERATAERPRLREKNLDGMTSDLPKAAINFRDSFRAAFVRNRPSNSSEAVCYRYT